MGIEPSVLKDSVDAWNRAVDSGRDRLGRPQHPWSKLSKGLSIALMRPVISNTQGGPRHDEHQRVINPFAEPIDGLYTAGELGSIWGSLYTGGCNLAECFITGKLAAEHAMTRNA